MLQLAGLQDTLERSFLGGRFRFEPVVDSTNRIARDMIADGENQPFMVLTDFQQAGRGRRGRQWTVPAETSLLSTMAIPVDAGTLTHDLIHVAALSVGDAISSVDVPYALKWPNDVLIAGKKLSGILAEMVRGPDRTFVIVGVGINVNVDFRFVPDVRETATSVSEVVGRKVSREAMLAAYIGGWDRWYGQWQRAPDVVFAAWKERLATLRRDVLVVEDGHRWHGYAVDVLRDGALLVRTADGHERAVYAADVSVRAV